MIERFGASLEFPIAVINEAVGALTNLRYPVWL